MIEGLHTAIHQDVIYRSVHSVTYELQGCILTTFATRSNMFGAALSSHHVLKDHYGMCRCFAVCTYHVLSFICTSRLESGSAPCTSEVDIRTKEIQTVRHQSTNCLLPLLLQVDNIGNVVVQPWEMMYVDKGSHPLPIVQFF